MTKGYYQIQPIDFEEVYFFPTPEGMKLIDGEGVGAPFHFRLEIKADSRDDWRIVSVAIIDTEIISQSPEGCRTRENIVPLTGSFMNEVADFFYKSNKFGDIIQDKVNLEIIEYDY